VNDSNSLGLSSARKQELGRLEEVEEEESRAEETQGQGAHGVDEVSPALIDGVVDDEDPSDCWKSKSISAFAGVCASFSERTYQEMQ
jgi:hypothetical protein